MKPAPFDLHPARSADDALEVLARADADGVDAKVLAGGQSLVALMNLRLARPELLVDLNGVAELDHILVGEDGLRIGAMTRQRTLERSAEVRDGWPLLSDSLPFVAHAPIRNRGTLGGSLAHADPGAELGAVALALDARVRVHGPAGEREIPVGDLFLGPFMTTIDPSELVTEIFFPILPPATGWAFVEVARRRGDFALAGVAALLRVDGDGRIADARLAYLSVAPTPVRISEAEAELIGQTPGPEAFATAAETAGEHLSPTGDIHASGDFRRHLATVLTGRALARAHERAGGRAASGT